MNELQTNPTQAMIPLNQLHEMAEYMVKSGMFGLQRVEQAVTLMMIAQAEGRHPATIAADYHIIMGRPSIKTEVLVARFLDAGGKIEWLSLTDTHAEARFSHPQGGSVTIDWSIDRAKKAGLMDKKDSLWLKYPRALLRSRVSSEGIRTVCPGATRGLYTVTETEEIDIAEEKYAGRAERATDAPPKPQPAEQIKDTYPEESINTNWKAWAAAIKRGRLTFTQIFDKIERTHTLTDDQKDKICLLIEAENNPQKHGTEDDSSLADFFEAGAKNE